MEIFIWISEYDRKYIIYVWMNVSVFKGVCVWCIKKIGKKFVAVIFQFLDF